MANYKVGITERGDANVDYTWIKKLGTVSGAILITKNLTDGFIQAVLNTCQGGYRNLVVHATATGWGSTFIEPNVPDYRIQLQNLVRLVSGGFPLANTVLRIDPIWPTPNGIAKAMEVIRELDRYPSLEGIRIRISILDQYRHVKKRFEKAGYGPINGGSFHAPAPAMEAINEALASTGHVFECCAEPNLAGPHILHRGCVSETELKLFGLPIQENPYVNPQNRNGCLCLGAKTELLTKRKPCPHNCMYCFWKRPGE